VVHVQLHPAGEVLVRRWTLTTGCQDEEPDSLNSSRVSSRQIRITQKCRESQRVDRRPETKAVPQAPFRMLNTATSSKLIRIDRLTGKPRDGPKTVPAEAVSRAMQRDHIGMSR
jgi:hypothetical protein